MKRFFIHALQLVLRRASSELHSSLFIILALTFTSCDDFLDITPTGKVIPSTFDEYRALLGYEYNNFTSDRYMTTIRTDEVRINSRTSYEDRDAYLDLWLWKDEDPSPTTTYFSWRTYYHNIYIANYILEHRGEIKNGSSDAISQLIGEAYMMRAYCHFLLVNLFAQPYTHCTPSTTRGVPIMLAADVNAMPRSSSVEAVYQQVISDLDEAAKYMKQEKWEKGYNYRFNVASVSALRARTYLYMGEWQKAYEAAQVVINSFGDLEDLNSTTAKLPNDAESVENIVALEHFSTNMSTVVNQVGADLISKYRTGDQRKKKYYDISSSIPTLLKTGGYSSFRSAEAYLTAAEALAQQGKTAEAIAQLLPLLNKRLNSTALTTAQELMTPMTQSELLQEIYDERFRELAFEGHRWYDLRRTTQPQLTRTYSGVTYTLTPEKYTMKFPPEAVEANPEIAIWERE